MHKLGKFIFLSPHHEIMRLSFYFQKECYQSPFFPKNTMSLGIENKINLRGTKYLYNLEVDDKFQ